MSHTLDKVTALSPAFSPLASGQNNQPRVDFTPDHIGLLIIMDNARGTEKHFVETIRKANPNAKITLLRMRCATGEDGKHYFTEADYLQSDRFADWQDHIGKTDFTQVIMTGINRGNLTYPQLQTIYPKFHAETIQAVHAIDQSVTKGKTGHATYVCWSGFAYMKAIHGVDKSIHDEKFYGLFPHKIAVDNHPLADAFGTGEILIPQSRYSYMDRDELEATIAEHDGEVVLNGPDGPAIWTLGKDRRTSIIINHPEYSIDTLNREWNNGKRNSRPDFPAPQNYAYNPEGQNPELEVVFDRLGVSCANFYQNLIAMAKEQKAEADLIRQNAEIVTEITRAQGLELVIAS